MEVIRKTVKRSFIIIMLFILLATTFAPPVFAATPTTKTVATYQVSRITIKEKVWIWTGYYCPYIEITSTRCISNGKTTYRLSDAYAYTKDGLGWLDSEVESARLLMETMLWYSEGQDI